MQHFILVLSFLFTSAIMAQTEASAEITDGKMLKVQVVNALNNKGTVAFALYNEESFMKAPLLAKSSTIEAGISTVVFENVPDGEYAIVCFHDANSNGKMDFHENGMPKESYGTSNNTLNFGPPQFENAKFIVNGDTTQIDIRPKHNSGLIQAMKILEGIKGISIVEFDDRDIIRHHLVKYIDHLIFYL